VVDIPGAAIAWLEAAGLGEKRPGAGLALWWTEDKGIAPSNLKDLWPAFRDRAGVERWPKNAMRHTFASMHYAHHQNEALLQVQMGHRSKDELFQHYRALKTRDEAAKFWALRPEGK
jgi:integrase